MTTGGTPGAVLKLSRTSDSPPGTDHYLYSGICRGGTVAHDKKCGPDCATYNTENVLPRIKPDGDTGETEGNSGTGRTLDNEF